MHYDARRRRRTVSADDHFRYLNKDESAYGDVGGTTRSREQIRSSFHGKQMFFYFYETVTISMANKVFEHTNTNYCTCSYPELGMNV